MAGRQLPRYSREEIPVRAEPVNEDFKMCCPRSFEPGLDSSWSVRTRWLRTACRARPSSGVIIYPRGRCDEHGDSIAEE